jgi:hypothetical protein
VRQRWYAGLLLLPFVLSGCGVVNTLIGGGPVTGAAPSAAPSASPWIAVTRGSVPASPSPSYRSPSPSAAAGFLPLPAGPATPMPTPAVTCPPVTYDFARINVLGVTPGTTTAMVSFYNLGGYNLVQFRLTAISQQLASGKQRDIGWKTITPTAPCGQVTATLTGLARKTGYVFSLDAVVTRISGAGLRAATVFRSGVVFTK